MKVLNIVETAYRGTLEEQDDTVLWLSQVLQGAGANLAVLLRGNAVNYGVRGQDASGLAFGELRQTQPPRPAEDLARLIERGTLVHVVEEDLAERGIEQGELVPGLKPISRRNIAALLADFDQVWHW
jgi:sulfur transfer complex TusBCD TusB component (DsrH family)